MGQKAYVTLTFDDGRQDNCRIFTEILEPNNIPATLYVATGYIEGKCTLGEKRSDIPQPMTIQEIIRLHSNPLFEIAAHGHMHKNDSDDITKGRTKLLEWLELPENTKIGFASPGSDMTKEYINKNSTLLTDLGFQYIRTGPVFGKFEEKKQKLNKKLHSGWLFVKTYEKSIMKSVDGLSLRCVPVLHDDTVKELKAIVEETKRKNAWVVILFHSISKEDEKNSNSTWSYDYGKFEQFIQYLVKERSIGNVELLSAKDAFGLMNGCKLKIFTERKNW